MAKRIKPPLIKRIIKPDYSDCSKCELGMQCDEYPELFYCDKRVTPQLNCLEKRIVCVHFTVRNNDERNVLL